MYKLLGFNRFDDKKGNSWTKAYFNCNWDQRSLDQGAEGYASVEVFVPSSIASAISKENIGKSFRLSKDMNNRIDTIEVEK